METIIYICLFAIGAALFYCYSKMGKLLRCVLFSAASGMVALGAVWLISRFTDIAIEYTPFTVLTASLLGIPGVVAMMIFRVI